jgi:hypothetical protein
MFERHVHPRADSHHELQRCTPCAPLSECQGKYAAFVSKRLAEDFAMPSRLAECKSPMEVIDVWAGFYRTAMGTMPDMPVP